MKPDGARVNFKPLVAALLACFPLFANAHSLSAGECEEVAQFLKHAAISREAGFPEANFMQHLQEDLALLQNLPPDLRWVAQDSEDEAMLIQAVQRVFQQPVAPQDHASEFLAWCVSSFR